MKVQGILTASVAMLLMATMPSCSLFNKNKQTDSSSKSQTTVTRRVVAKPSASTASQTTVNTSDSSSSSSSVGSDRRPVARNNQGSAATPAKKNPLDKLPTQANNGPDGKATTMPIKKEIMKVDDVKLMQLNGLWTLRNINGITLDATKGDSEDNRPYINFDSRDGKFYANDGCNTLNGNFTANQSGKLTIDLVLSTMMACPDAEYEQQFKMGLTNTATFKRADTDDELVLRLYNSRNSLIMTLVRPKTDFLNGSWEVVAIDGKKINNPEVRMVIDIPELKVHGNSGCNTFNGSIFVDPDKNGTIQFENIAITRMMCPDIATETALMVALESVVYARQVKNEAQLLNVDKEVVVTMKPLKLEE